MLEIKEIGWKRNYAEGKRGRVWEELKFTKRQRRETERRIKKDGSWKTKARRITDKKDEWETERRIKKDGSWKTKARRITDKKDEWETERRIKKDGSLKEKY